MDLIVKHNILKNKDIDFIDLFNCDKFSTFLKKIKKAGCPNEIFELFVELLIMTHQAANTIGIGDYLPSISDNILAIGTDINLNPCAIKTIFKYENNQIFKINNDKLGAMIVDSMIYHDIYDNFFIFTSGKDKHHTIDNIYIKKNIKVYGYEDIRKLVDNNKRFQLMCRTIISKGYSQTEYSINEQIFKKYEVNTDYIINNIKYKPQHYFFKECLDFNSLFSNNTLQDFINKAKEQSLNKDLELRNVYLGNCFELLCEFLIIYYQDYFKFYNYKPTKREEDYGVDGYGDGFVIQCKFKSNKFDVVDGEYDHIDNFIVDAYQRYNIKTNGENIQHFIFTTCLCSNYRFSNILKVFNYDDISILTTKNFWDFCLNCNT